MPAIPRTPIHFREIFKGTLWGGRRFERLLRKRLPPGGPVGEAWEVCDHAHGESTVDEGSLAGTTLHQLVERDELGLIGRRKALAAGGRFPLIFKFIDATQRLSVQVHPSDAYALEHEGGECGKTEAWFVVHAMPGAKIVRGLKAGTTRQTLVAAARTGSVDQHLVFVEVKRGDVVLIPAGVVHAVGEGVLLAEIQESSDATYRLHDWNRVGADGKPRELHVEKALDVIDFGPGPKGGPLARPEVLGRERPWHERFAANDKFTFDRWTATEPFELHPAEMKSFVILSCIDGVCNLVFPDGSRAMGRGETVLLPGAMKTVTIRPNGRVELLAMSLPVK